MSRIDTYARKGGRKEEQKERVVGEMAIIEFGHLLSVYGNQARSSYPKFALVNLSTYVRRDVHSPPNSYPLSYLPISDRSARSASQPHQSTYPLLGSHPIAEEKIWIG